MMSNTTIFREINPTVLDIGNGYQFCWMSSGGEDNEISGYIEKPEGGILDGSMGWYCTDDPQLAAFRAVNAMDLPIIRTV